MKLCTKLLLTIRSFFLFYILFNILLSSSCIAQKGNIPDQSTLPVTIPFLAKEIAIVDGRIGKQSMNWHVPTTSIKPIEFTGHPDMTSADSTAIITMIKRSQNLNGKPTKITVLINEGVGKLYGDWKSARESVKVSVELEIEELEGTGFLRSTYEVIYEKKTFNAQKQSVLEAYSKALKNCIYQCLLQLSNFKK